MSDNRTRLILLTAILISISFPVTICKAQNLNIQPKFSASWRVDSNYYLAQDVEREVYTYKLQPGFTVDFKAPKSTLMLDYSLDAYYYDDRDSVPPGEQPTDKDDYIGHTLTGEARHQTFDRLLLGLNESYYKTRDPAESDPFSNSIDREKYYINRITPFVVYNFAPKFTVRLRYRNTKINYDPSSSEDSTENRGLFNLIYNFTRRSSVDFEFQHWKKDYDAGTSDYSADQGKLIFRKELRIFRISAGAGYQNRSFDDSGLDDIDVFTYHLDLDGEGTLANRRTYVALNVEQNFNDQSTGNNYYTATRFILRGGHEFSSKLSGDAQALYLIADYELNRRKDDIYELSGSINYKFARWLTFSVTGGIEKRDSNLEGLDYDNTYFIANLKFAYDLGRK